MAKPATKETALTKHDPETGEVMSFAKMTEMDFGEHAGKGSEMAPDVKVIPFFDVLQSNSPQVDRAKRSHLLNPAAKAGDICNTTLGDLHPAQMEDGEPGIIVVPVEQGHQYVSYIPRNAGGGFVNIYAPNDPLILKLRKEQGDFRKLEYFDPTAGADEKGATVEIVEYYTLFAEIYVPMDGLWYPTAGILRFKSTQIPKFKVMMTMLDKTLSRFRNGRPPLWAFAWRFRTVPQPHRKGNFFGWHIAMEGGSPETAFIPMSDKRFKTAAKLYEQVTAGMVKADYEADAENGNVIDAEAGSTEQGTEQQQEEDAF